MITHRANESTYTAPLSVVNGLSRLTTASNGQARPIRKFSNRPMTFESNWNGRFKSNLEASQVPINHSINTPMTATTKSTQISCGILLTQTGAASV